MKYPIDLSMLTPEEIEQFDDNMIVLQQGEINVALYLRYSSDRQTEQSIEGQLRDAIAFCERNQYRICAVYVDRAITARKDTEKRVAFMQMIADSARKNWSLVIVWKLDRFARNKADSVIAKAKLSKNGVRVISATEIIPDNPEGIILESLLEGMAEYYSAELAQKITRGMRETALKCKSVGGHTPLGYKIVDHKHVIDPVGAAIVREAFEKYAAGWKIVDICKEFNRRELRSAKGAAFNQNSFRVMFRNKRYIGIYTYKGEIEVEGGVPAIIDKDLFDRVSAKLEENHYAPARGKAKVDYLLSGKLFCGHCGSMMIGESGKGRHGGIHYYYKCADRKRGGSCRKKTMRKELIEQWVAEDALSMLTPAVIEEIADIAIKQTELEIQQHTLLPALQAQYDEAGKGIANITAAIERGTISESLEKRLIELEQTQKALSAQIVAERHKVIQLDKEQIVFWLSRFANGDIKDDKFKRQIIDLLINSVTVWDLPDGDFRITTAYNLTEHPSAQYKASERFGYDASSSTIAVLSEPLICGTVFLLTKKHSP